MRIKRFLLSIFIMLFGMSLVVSAEEDSTVHPNNGGGYAVTGQIGTYGTSCKVYDANNGLPTSDANYILGSKSGYIYVGGYSGVLKYDGAGFERINAEDGLTSGRCFFEDSKGRIWVGTNDNGIVCLDNLKQTHFHAKDGLPSLCVGAITEDNKGRIIVGTASGLVYIDNDMNVVRIDEKPLNQSLITRLSTDSRGVVYGYSTSGYAFSIESGTVQKLFKGYEIGIDNISNVFADPKSPGRVYFGTYNGHAYYGKFGDSGENLITIDLSPIEDVRWISYDCERIWIASNNYIGYLDQNNTFHLVRDIPFNTDIEMLTSDYQGNIWVASSTMGIMKLVSTNFYNVSKNSPISNMVIFCTQFYKDKLYIGGEDGLFIVNKDGEFETDELTKAVGNARVRHIFVDSKNNIWIATYENNVGLLCQKPDGEIISYTNNTGISTNLIRCITETENGTIVVGTSKGINYINDYKISHPVDISKELNGTVVLSLIEKDGEIYAGTSGEGIYIISDRGVRHLGLEKGLTSDIVMRIKWDDQREVLWLITSNSIQYIKNDIIVNVSSFPYNNCYELFFDHTDDEIWVLASNGIYCVEGQEMLDDKVKSYKQYNLQNGLPAMPTANAYSYIDNNGDMYLASRKGVFRFNVDTFVEEEIFTIIDVNKVICDGDEVFPDTSGGYVIPAGTKRISFVPAILDYSESNPMVRMSLEGVEDEGVTLSLNNMKPLEYTGVKYGDYYLKIELLNRSGDQVVQQKQFSVHKTPRFYEMLLVQFVIVFLVAVLGGLLAWRILSKTIISRQHQELVAAKKEVELATSVKDRFIANISNILRNPLITIMGMDEMILRRDPSISPNEYFFSVINDALDIKEESENLLELIDALINIAKTESGKMQVEEKEYDTVPIIQSAVAVIRTMCIDKGISFEIEVDECLPVRLKGDIDKISQIILTFLNNAVKYTPMGGVTLRISVDSSNAADCYLRVSVKDTGLGIPEKFKNLIFNSLEELGTNTEDVPYEFGLGLNLAQTYAKLMNGTIICESEEGQGAEFILFVKQTIVDEKPIGQFRERQSKVERGVYVPKFIAPDAEILIADSNVKSRDIIKGLLKDTKMFITTASTGEEALEKIKFGNYNVVLLDYFMPDIDGEDLITRIKEDNPKLPVYALSSVSTEDEDFYIAKGYAGLMLKPLDSEVLEKTILKHIPNNIYIKLADMENDMTSIELPEEMMWLYDIEELDVKLGMRICGGPIKFISSLKVFMEGLNSYVNGIEEAYKNLDIKLYTIKAHSLKTAFAVVGASNLEAFAEALEAAGNRNDMDYISSHIDKFLIDCRSLYSKLSKLHSFREET